MSKYALANSTIQWFQGKYPGAVMKPNCCVLHTTEGTSWPDYDGGAIAPNYTAFPVITKKRMDWRQHFPDERSSRALVNAAGGVETNTLGAVQLELVGTCDPVHAKTWGKLKAGVDYIYWPDAPDWCLEAVADFIRDQRLRHGIKLTAPTFKDYPGSYGAHNGVRFTFAQWRNFYGVCGHQHVPENVHGDPGGIAIQRILHLAGAPAAKSSASKSRGKRIDTAIDTLDAAKKANANHPVKQGRIAAALSKLRKIKAK